MAWRRRRSMATRNAASVFPEPVGAEMRVGSPATMEGQPPSCGSVGVPNLATNHSCTMGWAQAREAGMAMAGSATGMADCNAGFFVLYSPGVSLPPPWTAGEELASILVMLPE